ncbi:MAG: YHYH protein [Oceanococcus sp.]
MKDIGNSKAYRLPIPFIASALASLLVACGDSGSSADNADDGGDPIVTTEANRPVDATRFDSASVSGLQTVDCTLSNGSVTTCYEFTLNGFPADRASLGPFCPQTTSTGAMESGKWFDNGVLYDLTGAFVANLANFYADDNWQLFDESTGAVRITDTQEACEAAARPDVAEEYNNFCVECDIAYYNAESGQGVSATYLIPTTPQPRSEPGQIGGGGVGAAYNGVKLDAAAPTDAILSAYTIAAFDDCVGHVNPAAGYHYHGANQGEGDCPGIAFEADGHGGAFGYALDGYAIHTMLDSNGNEETDLDVCRGHTDDARGYHYHTASSGENAFIGCFTGETVDDGSAGGPPGGGPPGGLIGG